MSAKISFYVHGFDHVDKPLMLIGVLALMLSRDH
jgi:hypothetical protein